MSKPKRFRSLLNPLAAALSEDNMQESSVFRFRDTGLSYSPITLMLHWMSALMVFVTIAVEIWIFISLRSGVAANPRLLGLHATLGVILAAVGVVRLRRRLTQFQPLALGGNPMEDMIARLVALGLVFALVVLPVLGWIGASARGDTVLVFGSFDIGARWLRSELLSSIAIFLYRLGGLAFILGLALHVLGALKSHFVLGNESLVRILGKEVEL